jgi:hypothetical protein
MPETSKNIIELGQKKIESVYSKIKDTVKQSKTEIKETRILVRIIIKAVKDFLKTKDFDLSDEDKKFIKDQSGDILKLIPLIVFQLVPGSTIATPFILKLAKKAGVTLKSELPKKYKDDAEGGEIDELVDADGSLIGSDIPLLQQPMHPRKTMDVTVIATRQTNNPIIRGYRVYYGESKEGEDVLDEENMKPAFAYKETRNNRTYSDCMKTMKEMGIEEVIERNERCKTFGFEKKYDRQLKNQKRRGKCKNCFTKRRLAELEKEKMNTLLDEIILNKKNKTTDVVKKKDDDSYNPVEKILIRNIESIKKIAEKEGLDINSLLKKLKDEQ